jgi:hypothetical protein
MENYDFKITACLNKQKNILKTAINPLVIRSLLLVY